VKADAPAGGSFSLFTASLGEAGTPESVFQITGEPKTIIHNGGLDIKAGGATIEAGGLNVTGSVNIYGEGLVFILS